MTTLSRRRFLAAAVASTVLCALAPSRPSRRVGVSVAEASSLAISSVSDNQSSYTNAQIPAWSKLEITFQLTGGAFTNTFFPYDASPPTGASALGASGVTVSAQFSQDNFQTSITQPCFSYQGFTYTANPSGASGTDWVYPDGTFAWKCRWATGTLGPWQYRLMATDSSGTVTTTPTAFTVVASTARGPVRAALSDARYFETSDGKYFPGLGYNLNYDQVSWHNPVQDNTTNFQNMQADGVQLVRLWLSQWGIFGAQEPFWGSLVRGSTYTSLQTSASNDESTNIAFPTTGSNPSNATMLLAWPYWLLHSGSGWAGSPAMVMSAYHDSNGIPCKPNTQYQITVTYWIQDSFTGPAIAGYPYGLSVKFGPWLVGSAFTAAGDNWPSGYEASYPAGKTNSVDPGANVQVLNAGNYPNTQSTSWQTLTATFTTDSNHAQSGNNYLRYLYLCLENVTGDVNGKDASAYIDSVQIQEVLGAGAFGTNIVPKGWMSQCFYPDQWHSYKFDQVLALAEQYGISLKIAGLEKTEDIQNSFDFSGNPAADTGGSTCANFYGNGTSLTYVRWLQQAYWRYLHARWGYSSAVHSWELCNEQDPNNGNGYDLAQAFGAYMHQFAPRHLVTTSFWSGFPKTAFWANSSFPDLDYADIHDYVETDSTQNGGIYFNDSALATVHESASYGAKTAGGANKPTMRGETGFVTNGSNNPTALIGSSSTGLWLHKFNWAQINPNALIESYWYMEGAHGYPSKYGSQAWDYRPQFAPYAKFIGQMPLNVGTWTDAAPSCSNSSGMRAYGQKDLSTTGWAIVWVDNSTDTWSNLVNSPASITSQSGNVTIVLNANQVYTVTPFDTNAGTWGVAANVTADGSGNVTWAVSLGTSLGSSPEPDVAYLITPRQATTDDWTQLGANPQHTNYSPETIGVTTWTKQWGYSVIPDRVFPEVQPIVYFDGLTRRCYFGTEGGIVHAVNQSNGTSAWTYQCGGPIVSTVAVDRGIVYVTCMDGSVYALGAASGALVWKTRIPSTFGMGASPILNNRVLYVVTRDGVVASLSAYSGVINWTYAVGTQVLNSPAYDATTGDVVVCGMDMYVRAITDNGASASLHWTSPKINGMAFYEGFPVITSNLILVRPVLGTYSNNNGLTPGFPLYSFSQSSDWTWLSTNGATVAAGNAMSVSGWTTNQAAAISAYNANPGNYTMALVVLAETTGAVAKGVLNWDVLKLTGAKPPPAVDSAGNIIVPDQFVAAGGLACWGRQSLATGYVVDPLFDGLDVTGATYGQGDNNRLTGSGNVDENVAVSCAANAVLAFHIQEANAQYTGYFDLTGRRWHPVANGNSNPPFWNVTESGGSHAASISNQWVYHIVYHELIGRSTA